MIIFKNVNRYNYLSKNWISLFLYDKIGWMIYV